MDRIKIAAPAEAEPPSPSDEPRRGGPRSGFLDSDAAYLAAHGYGTLADAEAVEAAAGIRVDHA